MYYTVNMSLIYISSFISQLILSTCNGRCFQKSITVEKCMGGEIIDFLNSSYASCSEVNYKSCVYQRPMCSTWKSDDSISATNICAPIIARFEFPRNKDKAKSTSFYISTYSSSRLSSGSFMTFCNENSSNFRNNKKFKLYSSQIGFNFLFKCQFSRRLNKTRQNLK